MDEERALCRLVQALRRERDALPADSPLDYDALVHHEHTTCVRACVRACVGLHAHAHHPWLVVRYEATAARVAQATQAAQAAMAGSVPPAASPSPGRAPARRSEQGPDAVPLLQQQIARQPAGIGGEGMGVLWVVFFYSSSLDTGYAHRTPAGGA
jgi:hypothetical protein